jgi:class 3 adenylate cyclase
MAIQALGRASGIAVRAGLHTGECERLDDGLAGVAVHIAARVCALGCADDVMTTGTVRDLVTGSMLAFEPRGHHELRGVPGSWPVFSATDPA